MLACAVVFLASHPGGAGSESDRALQANDPSFLHRLQKRVQQIVRQAEGLTWQTNTAALAQAKQAGPLM